MWSSGTLTRQRARCTTPWTLSFIHSCSPYSAGANSSAQEKRDAVAALRQHFKGMDDMWAQMALAVADPTKEYTLPNNTQLLAGCVHRTVLWCVLWWTPSSSEAHTCARVRVANCTRLMSTQLCFKTCVNTK